MVPEGNALPFIIQSPKLRGKKPPSPVVSMSRPLAPRNFAHGADATNVFGGSKVAVGKGNVATEEFNRVFLQIRRIQNSNFRVSFLKN